MSFQLYPHQESGLICDDYEISVNGTVVLPDAARVSAQCFNRRWPGHQRPLDQTETVAFLCLAADEPVNFSVTAKAPFEKVVIRPLEKGVTPTVSGQEISFTLPGPGFYTVEPYGRNHALHLFVDAPQTYEAGENEQVIRFGPGVHEAGEIRLQSNTTLLLEEGALVYGSVIAEDAENVKVLGHGILDNSRNKETILFEVEDSENSEAIRNAERTPAMLFRYCKNVTVDGILVRDSLLYHIRPICCENVTIRNTKVLGSWRYNSDGFDTHNCAHVLIDNCFVRTYDDCICIKGFDFFMDPADMKHNGRVYDTCEDYLIKNCVLWNDWGRCLEIGAETRAEEIKNVRFENCALIHVTAPIMDCQNVDYADVHEIAYENISVEFDDVIPFCSLQKTDKHVYELTDPEYVPPLFESIVYRHPEYSHGGGRRGINRNILIKNIRVYGRQPVRLSLKGYDENHQTHHVTVSQITQNGKPAEPIVEKNAFTSFIVLE